MDQEEQRGPERDKRAFIYNRPAEDAVNEKPCVHVEQEIHEMIAGWIETIQRAIEQKGRVQDGTDHVIKMPEKNLPVFEMPIPEE